MQNVSQLKAWKKNVDYSVWKAVVLNMTLNASVRKINGTNYILTEWTIR